MDCKQRHNVYRSMWARSSAQSCASEERDLNTLAMCSHRPPPIRQEWCLSSCWTEGWALRALPMHHWGPIPQAALPSEDCWRGPKAASGERSSHLPKLEAGDHIAARSGQSALRIANSISNLAHKLSLQILTLQGGNKLNYNAVAMSSVREAQRHSRPKAAAFRRFVHA